MKNKVFTTFIIMYAVMYTFVAFLQYDFTIAIKIFIKGFSFAVVMTIIPFFLKKLRKKNKIITTLIIIYALMSTSVAFLQYDFAIAIKIFIEALGFAVLIAILIAMFSFFQEKIQKRNKIK